MLLKKRFLSSPWAFARTSTSTSSPPPSAAHMALDDYYTEVLGSDQADEEEGYVEQPEFDTLRRTKVSDPLVAAAAKEIDRLVAWGEGYQHRPDSRLTALMDDAQCRLPTRRHTWTNERVVVFTEYAATLDGSSTSSPSTASTTFSR